MPYITPEDRNKFNELDEMLDSSLLMNNAGELQYYIAKGIKNYLYNQEEIRYAQLNEVMGALNGANLEFYRRYVAPYEDKKILENGDV